MTCRDRTCEPLKQHCAVLQNHSTEHEHERHQQAAPQHRAASGRKEWNLTKGRGVAATLACQSISDVRTSTKNDRPRRRMASIRQATGNAFRTGRAQDPRLRASSCCESDFCVQILDDCAQRRWRASKHDAVTVHSKNLVRSSPSSHIFFILCYWLHCDDGRFQ